MNEGVIIDSKAPVELAQSGAKAAPMASVQLKQPLSRKWHWRWIFFALIGIIMVGGLFYYLQPFSIKPVVVDVEAVTSGPVTRVLAVNGRIAAMHSVDVRASVSGTISALPIVEGTKMRFGGVLAKINATAQEAMVRQSRASLDAGRLAQAQTEANYERLAALKGVVTRASIESAQSNARSAREDVRRLVALFDQAQIELAKFTVLAPTSGTIISIDTEIGQLIDPSKALATIADLDQLIVETDVDEAYSTQIKPRMPVVLKLVGETNTQSGKVSFISPNVNAATGGLAIKIGFDEPISAPVGLTVTINIIVDRQENALSVPRAAIVKETVGSFVFVFEAGLARKRPITVIDWPAERLIVTDGLEIGDIVIADVTGIVEGQKVRVRPETTSLTSKVQAP